MKLPRLSIINVESDYIMKNDEDIIRSIIEQNEISKDYTSKLKVFKKYIKTNRRNCGNIILELDPTLFNTILENGIIKIGWRQCTVYEYIGITQCYKCARFNHLARDCKNEITCVKCSGKHNSKECEENRNKCVNCVYANQKTKLNLPTDHTAHDKQCPCYLRMVTKEQGKIERSQ
ncbi:hypothetical protein WA026_010139 [Henosepilachna vigintioctopunctata]|uniref:CCHC-type domain-containing protein n=1 Tax=Henosepilachna vigintioctopunctata TaxID=420089 RepID=A0AAW1UBA5_9CUCU